MKLEVGMYVRTKDGYIDKILDISVEWYCLGEDEEEKPYKIYKLNKYYYDEVFDEDNDWVLESFLIKASHNIIDLIEKNDFVNGHRVIQVDRESLELDIENSMYGCGCETINGDRDIKSIVTREQFEQMQYKVGE